MSPDIRHLDYRAFMFVVLNGWGMLLLRCTRKLQKGPHFQLPGGHVDNSDFDQAEKKLSQNAALHEILLLAAKIGAARELYEETGLDFRRHLDRFQPAPLRSNQHHQEGERVDETMNCELERRIFFYLSLNDDDVPFTTDIESAQRQGFAVPMIVSSTTNNRLPMIKLSEEHSGFIFEPDPKESVKKIALHSNGVGSKALLMAMNRQSAKGVSI